MRELTISGTTYFEQFYNMTRDQFQNLSPAEQLKAIGVKSAPKQHILTEAEDSTRRVSRFKEENIVNAWAKWFKLQYANIPFMVDKIAQKRSRLGGAILSASNYRKGNPDIHIQCQRGSFAGCYIEQKTSEDIFYAGTRILKPGTDNRHIWQSLYHADLREQGYWVMFSVSLEATMKITQRYMDGKPYPQQVFQYYCKPEDYAVFGFHKGFCPVDKSKLFASVK